MIKRYHVRALILLFVFAAEMTSVALSATTNSVTQKATFAGGCFWCMEEAFEAIEGVVSVTSGYQGGDYENPTYEEVSSGTTGHFEVIEVIFNSDLVEYKTLLDIFWLNVDPTNSYGQFCDKGSQYRSGIFYHDEQQEKIIDQSLEALKTSKPFKDEIMTVIEPAKIFYLAEEKLQDYYKKHPYIYKFYKFTCGRAHRLEEVWGY